ncbi:hypothetical protein ACWEOH_00975 [Agromyces sp. NPDC004153]
MTRTLRAGALTAAALFLMLALAGCFGPAPTPTPTPDAATPRPTPTATPTAEPVDPLTTVTELVARPEVLELHDATGAVVTSLDYLTPAGPAVEALTTVLGAAPVDEDYPGNSHFPPSTVHRWDGFELWEPRYVDRWAEFAGEPPTLYRPGFRVVFTGPQSSSVSLSTAQHISVGGSWSDLQAMPDLQVNPSGCSGPYLDYIERDETWPDGTVHVMRFGVDFGNTDDPDAVTRIDAPTPIHEGGCA